jgi:hypothetical protein
MILRAEDNPHRDVIREITEAANCGGDYRWDCHV